MRRHAVVTGGAGFLGSHLVDRLLGAGWAVTAVDNLHTGSRANLAHLRGRDGFRLHVRDVRERVAATYPQVDCVWNLACPASPVHYQRDPVATVTTSVLGTLNALELAADCGCPMVQASTSEVYGDPEVHPQVESYVGHVDPLGPRACYDEGKRCAETLCADYRRERGVDSRIARLFNAYGPRMHPGDGRVVSSFVVSALRGEPLVVHGDGFQTRSFCYVDDAVEALHLMGEVRHPGPLNVGCPDEVTVNDLAELVVEMTRSGSPVRHVAPSGGDPRRRKPDASLAAEVLGWRATTSLTAGLGETIRHFRGLA